ncbi:MAG TPA: hypothetical protein PLU64_14410, partial [Saprospiraceae bacterium]|nr:hypothetical protein [Saprospiraceae bacterium]
IINSSDIRWILVETLNPWTGEVSSYSEEDTPEAFLFRADSTFTKFLIAENCSIEGAYELSEDAPDSFDLTYLEESSDCPAYYGYPPVLTMDNGQLIYDARPWDGLLLIYSKQ